LPKTQKTQLLQKKSRLQKNTSEPLQKKHHCCQKKLGTVAKLTGRSWEKLDDGWPESEKAVFQAALSMVVVKNSR